MSARNDHSSPSETEINECFGTLLEQIEHLKAQNAPPLGNWRDGYSPLEQAAYHLCQCRHLMETVARQSAVRRPVESRIIKFGV